VGSRLRQCGGGQVEAAPADGGPAAHPPSTGVRRSASVRPQPSAAYWQPSGRTRGLYGMRLGRARGSDPDGRPGSVQLAIGGTPTEHQRRAGRFGVSAAEKPVQCWYRVGCAAPAVGAVSTESGCRRGWGPPGRAAAAWCGPERVVRQVVPCPSLRELRP
jgi:hypothetical protein